MSIVYCVYTVYPNDDGWPDYSLFSICTTIDKCNELINKYKPLKCSKPIHSSMNESNNYTYIGNREDCNHNYLYGFGGYIIEETELDKPLI